MIFGKKIDKNEIEFDNSYKIVNFIFSSPGIRYNELRRITGLSNGVLSYHIKILERMGRILVDRKEKNNTTRFFPLGIEKQDSEIIAFLRNKTSQKILKILLENKEISFNEIADKLDKVPSTVSWHLKRMKDCNIVEINKINHTYKITHWKKVNDVFSRFNAGIVEQSVDDLMDTMEDL